MGAACPEVARPLTARPMRHDDPAGIPERLQRMNDAGVQMQILSPAASPPYAENETDAVAAARLVNDCYAELAATYPGRFGALVSLSLPHIDASLREMERGLDQLGMLGVSMTCSCFDRSTAEVEFEPPDRCPNITYVVPHLGGIIPMQPQRLDNQAPGQYPDLPERPSVTARRFYYDTVGHGSPAALLCAWKAFGADHLVAGSDYPVLMAFETYRQTFHYIRESGLPPEDADTILHHNSQRVLALPH